MLPYSLRWCCAVAAVAAAAGGAASPDAQPAAAAASTSTADKKAPTMPMHGGQKGIHGAHGAPPSYPAVLKGKGQAPGQGRQRPPPGQRGAPPPVPPRGSPRAPNKALGGDAGSRGEGSSSIVVLQPPHPTSPTLSWASSESSGHSSHFLAVEVVGSSGSVGFETPHHHRHCMTVGESLPSKDYHICLVKKHVACEPGSDVLPAGIDSSKRIRSETALSHSPVANIRCATIHMFSLPMVENCSYINDLKCRFVSNTSRNGLKTLTDHMLSLKKRTWEKLCNVKTTFGPRQSISCSSQFKLHHMPTSKSSLPQCGSTSKSSPDEMSSASSAVSSLGKIKFPPIKGTKLTKRRAPLPLARTGGASFDTKASKSTGMQDESNNKSLVLSVLSGEERCGMEEPETSHSSPHTIVEVNSSISEGIFTECEATLHSQDVFHPSFQDSTCVPADTPNPQNSFVVHDDQIKVCQNKLHDDCCISSVLL